ncbi:MAG: pyridoxal 5'-phosphate synthase glutaminase subunit PdxT [bacterium]|nr:pyridoxal 5'-phosphate synthase glutaminase subunit PdxT [bacterium]
MVVGVLALQGDFAEHCAICQSLDVHHIEVRTVKDLAKVDRLILPGGESTTISKLLKINGFDTAIMERVNTGMPIYGTCAGAILLATSIDNDESIETLKLLNVQIERNAYGTQLNSFHAEIEIQGVKDPIKVAFIRAPRITHIGVSVDVLASHNGDPILVKQGKILAGTFHPEVTNTTEIHKLFLEL